MLRQGGEIHADGICGPGFGKGELPRVTSYKKHHAVILALIDVASTNDFPSLLVALQKISEIDGAILYRRELWNEMSRTIKAYLADGYNYLQDTAWHIRDRARLYGRTVDNRAVTRTLLIKGLEFDHAIVLDADQHDTKNLYVAMTRGAKSLTVLSKNPIIVRKPFRE